METSNQQEITLSCTGSSIQAIHSFVYPGLKESIDKEEREVSEPYCIYCFKTKKQVEVERDQYFKKMHPFWFR